MPSRSIFLPAFERGLAAPFVISPDPTAEAEAAALLPRLLSPPADEEFFATPRVIQRLIPDLTPETVPALLRGLRLISRKKADKAAIDAVLAFLQGGGVGQFPALDPARQETRLSLALALERFGRFHEVLRIVGQLATENQRDGAYRSTLARLVSAETVRATGFTLAPPGGGPKVFDVFPFNNEFHLLDLKLAEEASFVDTFVLVEATRTFTGASKPLRFAERARAYAHWGDRLRHVVVDSFPDWIEGAWSREFHRRDQGLRALTGRVAPAVITYTDELILPSAVGNLGEVPAKLHGWLSRYFLNYRQCSERRGLMSAWRGAHLPVYGLSYARSVLPFSKLAERRRHVAWHFTNVAEPHDLADKMRASSHEEYAHFGADYYAPLLARIRLGERDPDWERIPVEALPPYVAEHRERFADLLI